MYVFPLTILFLQSQAHPPDPGLFSSYLEGKNSRKLLYLFISYLTKNYYYYNPKVGSPPFIHFKFVIVSYVYESNLKILVIRCEIEKKTVKQFMSKLVLFLLP